MCLYYNDVGYDYAFELSVRVPYKDTLENFQIAISKYRHETSDFTGLCLENELTIISEQKSPFLAFVDIINETVEITTSSIISYAKAHDGRIPRAQSSVENITFLNEFNERKKSFASMYYNKQLKNYYDHLYRKMKIPKSIEKEICKELNPNLEIQNYIYMTIYHSLLRARLPKVSYFNFFLLS